MTKLKNLPDRYELANELHARPFPQVSYPAVVGYIAFTADTESNADNTALSDLLKRHGATPVQPDVNHHFCELGACQLKWERHTEFVTYMLIKPVRAIKDHSKGGYELFPKDWLASYPGQVITAVNVVVMSGQTIASADKSLPDLLSDMFVAESMSASFVVGKEVIVAGDFRIDETDQIKFALFPIGDVGKYRVGRILQRVLEIETYKSLAMMALPIARNVFAELRTLDEQLAVAVKGLSDAKGSSQSALEELLVISAKIEELTSNTAYRFSASKAYDSLVKQRIEVLREERFLGKQTFAEFMMRRFQPSMRTCVSAASRLSDVSRRAARASDLLGTRVNVRQNAQNRMLLSRLDQRSDTQLRLQETVEGLSIVAISYYGVSLLSLLATPFAEKLGVEKPTLTAILVLPVVFMVAFAVRRIRRRLHGSKS